MVGFTIALIGQEIELLQEATTHNAERFSIIIPTYREAKNIKALIERIAADFDGQIFEVIVVDDDSRDGIESAIEELQDRYSWLHLIVRKAKKSLSLSALDGFKAAKHPLLVLMDGDLSHPPEKIPEMLKALQSADFVIGSRYVAGGSTDSVWPVQRRITSRFAAAIAQVMLPVTVKDPLSGFFALHRDKFLKANNLNPVGWKIGLELMLKLHCKNIVEIPIHFSERMYGKSKLNFKVAYQYLKHVRRLACYKLFS